MKLLGHDRKQCMSCGTEGPQKDMDNFTHCDNCNTAYCNDCFVDLGNVCTFCMAPIDYGDVDDQSIETDSSEDEEEKAIRVKRLKAKKTKAVAKKAERRPSHILKAFQARFGLGQTPAMGFSAGSQQMTTSIEEGVSLLSGHGSSEDDEDNGSDSSTSSQSTSSYDTEYQYQQAVTSPESSEGEMTSDTKRWKIDRARGASVRPRPEMASMELFQRSDDSNSDTD